jgi:hypothetical protein
MTTAENIPIEQSSGSARESLLQEAKDLVESLTIFDQKINSINLTNYIKRGGEGFGLKPGMVEAVRERMILQKQRDEATEHLISLCRQVELLED